MRKVIISVAILALAGYAADNDHAKLQVREVTQNPKASPADYNQGCFTRFTQGCRRWLSSLKPTLLFGPWAYYAYVTEQDWKWLFLPIGLNAFRSAMIYRTYNGRKSGAVTIDLVETKRWFSWGQKHIGLKSNVNVEIDYDYKLSTSWCCRKESLQAKGTMTIGDADEKVPTLRTRQSGQQTYDVTSEATNDALGWGKKINITSFDVKCRGESSNLFEGKLTIKPWPGQNDFTIDIISGAHINISELKKLDDKKLYVRQIPGENGWHIMMDETYLMKSWRDRYIASIFPESWCFSKGLKVQYNEAVCKNKQGTKWTPNNDTNALVSLAALMLKYRLRTKQ